MKTREQWIEEANTWIDNWCGIPTYEEVEGECYHIEGIENPVEYAKELWVYIEQILKVKY